MGFRSSEAEAREYDVVKAAVAWRKALRGLDVATDGPDDPEFKRIWQAMYGAEAGLMRAVDEYEALQGAI